MENLRNTADPGKQEPEAAARGVAPRSRGHRPQAGETGVLQIPGPCELMMPHVGRASAGQCRQLHREGVGLGLVTVSAANPPCIPRPAFGAFSDG